MGSDINLNVRLHHLVTSKMPSSILDSPQHMVFDAINKRLSAIAGIRPVQEPTQISYILPPVTSDSLEL